MCPLPTQRSDAHNINASTRECLMYWHLLVGVAVERDTMSPLSVHDHSVCSAMIFQLGCGLSAQSVRSAVLCQLGCHMSAQLNCNVSAQLHFVSSAVTCPLSCQTTVATCQLNCSLSSQVCAATCWLSLEYVSSADRL